jgi:UrcA family protein
MKMNTLTKLCAVVGLAAGLASAPALANANPDTFVFRVDAASLQDQNDVRTAYQRLSGEAQRYCQALGLTADNDVLECRTEVVANVVEAVGDERLSALHRQTTAELRLASAE